MSPSDLETRLEKNPPSEEAATEDGQGPVSSPGLQEEKQAEGSFKDYTARGTEPCVKTALLIQETENFQLC